jgi:hypothetical protein
MGRGAPHVAAPASVASSIHRLVYVGYVAVLRTGSIPRVGCPGNDRPRIVHASPRAACVRFLFL